VKSYREKIAKSFDRAQNYERYALMQREVAHELANYLLNFTAPNNIFEIGCGTGFLTEEILANYPNINDSTNNYLATDISPTMLACAKRKKNLSSVVFGVQDANQIILEHSYDWVVANLVFQWLDDLRLVFENTWPKVNKLIGFTTLLAGTFVEWQDLCKAEQLEVGTINFLSYAQLQKICYFQDAKIQIKVRQKKEHFANLYLFLLALKKCGAAVAKKEYLPNKNLRKLFEKYSQPFTITYNIAYCVMAKKYKI
jgi:malonyl-CoA O-methyltransferase